MRVFLPHCPGCVWAAAVWKLTSQKPAGCSLGDFASVCSSGNAHCLDSTPPTPGPALALMSCSFCCSVFTLLSGRRVAFHNLVLLRTLTSCIYLMAVLCSDRFLCTAPGPSPSVGCHLLSRERPSCFCSGGSFLHVLCFVEMNIFLLVDAFNLYFTSEPLLLCLMVLGSGSEFRRRGQRPSGGPGTWGVGLMPAGFRVARGLCL